MNNKITGFNNKGYVVSLSENALIALVLSVMEAYAVKHKSKSKTASGLEIFGSLYGFESTMADGRTLFRIEFVSVDTSAKQTKDFVEYNPEAIILKSQILNSFWPYYSYLGDFHSHTYSHVSEVEDDKRYFLSEGDLEDFSNNENFFRKMGARVSLVVTVASLQRAGSLAPNWLNNQNCFHFTMGNVRMWIAATCIYKLHATLQYTSQKDDLVLLDCPTVLGFSGEWVNFGRVEAQHIGQIRYKPKY